MVDLNFYEVSDKYIDYIVEFDNKVAFNKVLERRFKRKYIGILIKIEDKNYIAPLSSFKEKHKNMDDNIDFIKVGTYSVINLNNMFPVPVSELSIVDISSIGDRKYKDLLEAEYRVCKPK